MKKLLYIAILLVLLAFLKFSDAAVCCPNGCFENANCCGDDGNGYVGCFDENSQAYCPPQTVHQPTYCTGCQVCLVCACSGPETCSWVDDAANLCLPGEVCLYDDIITPNATACGLGSCPLCSDCDTGFLDTCSLEECHACETGECYFDNFLDGDCDDCDNAANCNSFNDDPPACNGQILNCDRFDCFWDGSQTECQECAAFPGVKCGSYDDQETCELNPCGGHACEWVGSCAEAPILHEIQPNPSLALINTTIAYTATAKYENGTLIDVTDNTSFVSGNSFIATVNGSVATGINIGVVNINAIYRTKTNVSVLTIGDPGINDTFCEIGRSEIQGNCTQTGDYWCWDINGPIGNQCCGDTQSDNYLNQINHSCTRSEVFDKVVYQTDPDDSPNFCGIMSLLANGLNTGSCNQESETFCWASSGYITNDGNCCGDDINEVWNYSTNLLLENILVDGSCYNSKWFMRDNHETTYYDLWTIAIIT